jgi:hypothetical protein
VFNERTETIRTIHDLKISKVDLAAIADVQPPRITEYINHRPVPSDKAQRIEEAVANIAMVWTALAPYRIETSNPDVFRRAVEELKRALQRLGADRLSLDTMAALRTNEANSDSEHAVVTTSRH